MQSLLIEVSHWGLALIPVLVLLAVFDWLDAFELVNFKEILILLLLGGVAALLSWPVSGRLLDTLPIGFSVYSRFVAPWIEEAIKGLVIVALFRMNRIGYKLDAVIAGFAIGAGFSVVENIIYLLHFPDYGAGTWLVRGFGTAVMHGATLAVLAAIAHQFAERENREAASEFDFHFWWFVPGYLVAVALHTAFNQFPDRPLVAMLGAIVVAPLTLIGIFYVGSHEAHRWLVVEMAEHRDAERGDELRQRRCVAQRPLARRSRRPQGRRARRAARRGRRQAGSALLGAADVARRRGGGDHARGGGR